MTEQIWDDVWLTIVSIVVWIIYLDHLYHSIRMWRAVRGYREFRGLFIAAMLQLGLTRIVVGSLQIAIPGVAFFVVLRNIVAPLLTIMLLTGAFVLVYTWRKDPTYSKTMGERKKEGKWD